VAQRRNEPHLGRCFPSQDISRDDSPRT
jgi:hypothetical protein